MKKKRIIGVISLIFLIVAGSFFIMSRFGLTLPALLSGDPFNSKALLLPDDPAPPSASSDGSESKDPEEFQDVHSINILLLGIDRNEEREEYMGVFRSDMISLIKLDLDDNNVNVLAIPRDTYTYVPVEGKKDKINHAYAYGSMNDQGVESISEAVSQFTGLPIDYYISLDMGPIPDIVDEIGGVEIDVEIDMKTHGADLSKGLQVLNGQQAFDYIHWRYSANGDIDRMKRQQKFLKALFKQQKDSGKLVESVRTLLRYKDSLGTNLTPAQMIALAKFANKVPNEGVNYFTVPGNAQTIKKISYWVPDLAATKEIIEASFID
ncbi:LCP family protein [Dehalobacterium formicoaceticum]|uniref:LCP family protein n=1 Tax=Dehalobacterium formicoaceticum TaxID=51515 RepID=A0ABT1Y2Z5_9FIRM|nr:LCP family protein [Dehalobacterium formicoaceticum]MCR6545247.1 LCP family protein [Dehalobacterium formicoaceticum]